jgi:hypothetical protein
MASEVAASTPAEFSGYAQSVGSAKAKRTITS